MCMFLKQAESKNLQSKLEVLEERYRVRTIDKGIKLDVRIIILLSNNTLQEDMGSRQHKQSRYL